MQRSDSFSSTGLGDATAPTYLGTRAHFSFYSSLLAFAEAVGNKHALKTQLKDFCFTTCGGWVGEWMAAVQGGMGEGLAEDCGEIKTEDENAFGDTANQQLYP